MRTIEILTLIAVCYVDLSFEVDASSLPAEYLTANRCSICERTVGRITDTMRSKRMGTTLRGHRLDANNQRRKMEKATVELYALEILEDLCGDDLVRSERIACENIVEMYEDKLMDYIKKQHPEDRFQTKLCAAECAAELNARASEQPQAAPPKKGKQKKQRDLRNTRAVRYHRSSILTKAIGALKFMYTRLRNDLTVKILTLGVSVFAGVTLIVFWKSADSRKMC